MKQNILNSLFLRRSLLLALPLLLAASCDDIDEADRIVTGNQNDWSETFQTSTITADGETFNVEDKHRMLIADFTGYRCINCPVLADYLVNNVVSNYPAVLVSLHMTTNSFSSGHPNGYNCASADSIANWILGKPEASNLTLPSVAIDNVEWNGKYVSSSSTDLGNLASAINRDCNVDKTKAQALIGMNIRPTADRKYELSTLVVYPKGNGRCNLKLWLIEEGLVSSTQLSPTGIIRNSYLNHGILRQVVNGSYEGHDLTLGADGMAVEHTTLDLTGLQYVTDNLRLVAIVTDCGGREVINCGEFALLP